MAKSNSSDIEIARVAETTTGTTPATPTFTKLRFNSEGLKINREGMSSDEIRSDRNIPDRTHVGGDAGGNLEGELSYGNWDPEFESLMHAAWSSDVLKNGKTQKAHSYEKKIANATADQYIRMTGMVANTMRLTAQARQKAMVSFDLMGIDGTRSAAAISGASYDDAPAEAVLNCATDFASLAMTDITSPKLHSVELNVNNNLRTQPELGALAPGGIGHGRFQVSGSIEAYFENEELLDAFLANDTSSLAFTLGRTTGKKYTFLVPALKISDYETLAGGNDEDLMASLTFEGIYDDSEACSLKITRAVS